MSEPVPKAERVSNTLSRVEVDSLLIFGGDCFPEYCTPAEDV